MFKQLDSLDPHFEACFPRPWHRQNKLFAWVSLSLATLSLARAIADALKGHLRPFQKALLLSKCSIWEAWFIAVSAHAFFQDRARKNPHFE